MARPKKPINYEAELSRIDAQIVRWSNTIKELQEEKEALQRQREQEQVSKLFDLCNESGLTADDVIAIVQNHTETTQESA